jgi:hypothetical protein
LVAASEHAWSSVFLIAAGSGEFWYAALHSVTAAAPPAGAPPLAAGVEALVVVEVVAAETEEDTADWIDDASDAAEDWADDTSDDTAFEIEPALGLELPHPAINAATASRAANESFPVTCCNVPDQHPACQCQFSLTSGSTR